MSKSIKNSSLYLFQIAISGVLMLILMPIISNLMYSQYIIICLLIVKFSTENLIETHHHILKWLL